MRSFWRWLQREELASGNPALAVRPPKAGRRLPETLDVDRMTRLLTPQPLPVTDGTDPLLAIRDLAIMDLFYSSGLRLAELVGLDLGLDVAYFAGLGVAAAQAAWHHRLIADRTRDGCFRAFRLNHWIGLAVFAGVLLDSIGRSGR